MNRLFLLTSFVLISCLSMAQKPREVILENDPVDWSDTAKQIVLIGIPVLLTIFGLIYVYKRKSKGESQNSK